MREPRWSARGSRPGRRLGAPTLSLGLHLLIVLAVLSMRAPLPIVAPSRPVMVSLIRQQPPKPAPAPAPSMASASASAAASIPDPVPTPRRRPTPTPTHAPAARPTPHRVVSPPASSEDAPSTDVDTGGGSVGLSDADVAGATTAGTGASGGACDMAGLLQAALRKDPLVQAAATGAGQTGGRNILVWNGDWVRRGGEDGKGLAAVREAIMWAIAFAPAPCRGQAVRGLVLLSLNEAPGAPRLVLGSGTWRWADLLTPRARVPDGEPPDR